MSSISIDFIFVRRKYGAYNKYNQTKEHPFSTARYFSSERLQKDHGPVPKKTGSVTKSAASHYFFYHLWKKRTMHIKWGKKIITLQN